MNCEKCSKEFVEGESVYEIVLSRITSDECRSIEGHGIYCDECIIFPSPYDCVSEEKIVAIEDENRL